MLNSKSIIKAIVVGGDHHNTLAVIRNLGKNNVKIYLVVHGNFNSKNDVCVLSSRYAGKDTIICGENEAEILNSIESFNESDGAVLFPCSDLAAMTIDNNVARLEKKFKLQGFMNKPGMVVELMDKWTQHEYAQQHGFPVAKTWKVDLLGNIMNANLNLSFPCIIKPEISAKGSKSDIMICADREAFSGALFTFVEKGYPSVIVQEFLIKDYEVCAYGCIVDNQIQNDDFLEIGGTIKKVREFPPKGGGSLTYAQFISNKKVDEIKEKILKLLYNEGYRGQYDIEFLVCGDRVILNEINFRHSGNGYGLTDNGVNAPYLDVISRSEKLKMPNRYKSKVEIGKYHMDDLNDMRHLKDYDISVGKWLIEFIFADAHSVFNIYDIPGTIGFCFPIIRRIIKRKVFKRD